MSTTILESSKSLWGCVIHSGTEHQAPLPIRSYSRHWVTHFPERTVHYTQDGKILTEELTFEPGLEG